MRIDSTFAAPVPLAGAKSGQAASRPAFRLEGAGGARGSSGARSAAPLATLDAILMLQGEEDPGERRRRSARRGQDLLDALDGLKAGLLSGQIDAPALSRIADRLAAGGGPSGDPGLDGIVGQIELRAKVELAKLGVS